MGMMQAVAMKEAVEEGCLPLSAAIEWHLSSNCYPPIPLRMVPVALAAIAAMIEEEPERMIALPEGITHRSGSQSVSANIVIRSLRLEGFLDFLE